MWHLGYYITANFVIYSCYLMLQGSKIKTVTQEPG